MSKREIKLPLTPITETTFKRQGWDIHTVGDSMNITDEGDVMEEGDKVYYYTIALPKERNDEYAARLVSNATDETGFLKDMGLYPGTFCVEIMGTDGLGLCTSEEELEVLYKVLTGDDIE